MHFKYLNRLWSTSERQTEWSWIQLQIINLKPIQTKLANCLRIQNESHHARELVYRSFLNYLYWQMYQSAGCIFFFFSFYKMSCPCVKRWLVWCSCFLRRIHKSVDFKVKYFHFIYFFIMYLVRLDPRKKRDSFDCVTFTFASQHRTSSDNNNNNKKTHAYWIQLKCKTSTNSLLQAFFK